GRRLPDTLREAEVAAGSRAVSQTGRELREAGSDRDKDERYRVRAENGRGKGQTAATVQDGIPVPAGSLKPMEIRPTETPTENGGNDGAVESREIQEQDSPLFPPPLGNPATAAGFPHSHRSGGGSPWPKHQTQKDRLPDGSPKPTRKQKSVAEPPLSRSSLQDHSVLETIPGFRIILRLENAQALQAMAARFSTERSRAAWVSDTSAASTPPEPCGMPHSDNPISTPLSVPASDRSLKSPRWPM